MTDLQTSPPNVLPTEPISSTILIVDDVPENLRLLSTALTQAGHEVRSAISGSMALMSAAIEPPALILLDVTMPEMDGFEVCRRLKAEPSTADIPVIFISALGEVIDKVAAFQVGGVDYITKPFQTGEVLARVHSQLELGRLKQRLQQQNQQLQTSLLEQQKAESQVRQLNLALEKRVAERTEQLQQTNEALKSEIQERQQAQNKLLHLAMYDPLTGLASRTLLLERLEQALQPPPGELRPNIAVVLLNCDRFETITDTLGHRQGDQLLIQIANRLSTIVSVDSPVARLRGDEFAILLTTPPAIELDLEGFVATLNSAVSDPMALGEYKIFTNPSIGIAVCNDDSQAAEHLLRDAYQAMAQAKQRTHPRNWQLFDPDMYQQALHRLKLESKLRRAIQENQFQLYYQPIVTLLEASENPSVVGFEALIRWPYSSESETNAPAKFISPLDFIPLAEETRLIVPLGDWIFETACQQIREWNQGRSPEEELFMSVNFSVHQLNRERVAQHIESIMNKTQIKPHWIKLEITESVLMENPKAVLNALEQLRAKGLQVSIDDFGTGYSSLSYLQKLPVDILKIDRTFIKNIKSAEDDVRILETILSLSRALDLDVVAEGIETQPQADCLAKLGSQYGQGYRFSKPLDSAAASSLLQRK